MNQNLRIAALHLPLLLFFWLAPSVYAGVSYSVLPLVIDENVEARDIKEHTLTLQNNGDVPVTIYPTVNNISLNAGGSIEEFLTPVESDQTSSLSTWIEIGRGGIDLFPGQTKTVTLTLRVNPNAKPGEYHALVGFPYGGIRDEAESKLKRGDAPGTIVSVSFEDERNALLKISRFLVDRFVTNSENSAATYLIKNPGEEPLVPAGEVVFYNSRGAEVGAVPVNPEKISIMSGEEHVFTAGVPAKGLFGRYKAFLNVEYGEGNAASVQDTTFFYVIPLKGLLIVLGGILAAVLLISLYVHRRYFDEIADDGSDFLPVHVRERASDPLHHDIDLREK
jgi:hypothetical protein